MFLTAAADGFLFRLRLGDGGDHLSFVSQSIILLEAGIRRSHCGHKGTDTVSNNTQAAAFKWCSVGTELVEHTITPPRGWMYSHFNTVYD